MKADEDRDPSPIASALVASRPMAEAVRHSRGALQGLRSESASTALTRAGFLATIDLCVRALAARLGTVSPRPIDDATANAETARTELWRWLHVEPTRLDDGTPVDFALFDDAIQRVGERLPRRGLPGQEHLTRAAWLLAELTHAPHPTPMAEAP